MSNTDDQNIEQEEVQERAPGFLDRIKSAFLGDEVPHELAKRTEQGFSPSFGQRMLSKLSGDDTPTVFGTITGSLVGPLGSFLKVAVMALGWTLLAGSSFTFGYDFIGAWLFRGFLGDPVSRFLSGAACFVLFDLAYTSSLISFFRSAKSNAQRAFYLLFFLVPFVLGLVASLSGFALLSEGATLDAGTLAGARGTGQFAVYAAIINLALYGIIPSALDPANIRRMLESITDSRHAEQEQLAELIMEDTAERTFYQTVRDEAYTIGHQRGRKAVRDFGARWRLNDSSGNGNNGENFPIA